MKIFIRYVNNLLQVDKVLHNKTYFEHQRCLFTSIILGQIHLGTEKVPALIAINLKICILGNIYLQNLVTKNNSSTISN